jgi:hypothetical protein
LALFSLCPQQLRHLYGFEQDGRLTDVRYPEGAIFDEHMLIELKPNLMIGYKTPIRTE